ncbi:MAG TPA: potassium-transporting ATPase subunit C [Gemmataceae bacterium]|nr:potassium-transporting ATPase subunit C [Gemmataceae bacterium]
MQSHLRANLWLLVLTVLICSVLYPVALWAIGQAAFRDQAQGSLIVNDAGKPIGSRLIAQEFKGDEYFQPRPSAVSYNAAASGASNWGASNYLLRERVARQLGPIVRYGKGAEKDGKKPGEVVGPDIEKWFQQDRYQKEPGIVAQWASLHAGVAEGWIKDTDNALKPQWKIGDKERDAGQSFLMQLKEDDPALHKELDAALESASASTSDISVAFFPLFSKKYPGEWLIVDELETPDKQKRKKLVRVKESSDIQGIFFDMWRQEHPHIALEEVPADMVMASASGLDPHITLKNAQYQLKHRIAEARAKAIILDKAKSTRQDFGKLDDNQRQAALEQARKLVETKLGKRLEDRLTDVIDELLKQSASAPLSGLAGVPLVNVLEINVALDKRLSQLEVK